MEVTMLGKKAISFTDDKDKEKTGLSIFYSAKTPDVIGLYADRLWIDKEVSPSLYAQLDKQNLEKPVQGEFVYEIIPGRKKAVLMDIKVKQG